MSQFQTIRPRSSNPTDEDPSRQLPTPGGSLVSIGKGRKRKAPAHVSQNACTNCKRARAKCDGVDGQTCSRCNSRGLTESCTYELHIKTAKEELVKKIKHLENEVDSLHSELKDKDSWIQALKEAFSPGTRGSLVLQRLEREDSSYRELINLLSNSPSSSKIYTTRDGESEDAMDTEDESAPSRWTNVTQDDNKIHHLMALYFAWVHPVHMLFSERHFMESFKYQDRTYCSPALVNAICAMGCRYCIDDGGVLEVVIRRLGDRFLQQARAELKVEKSMTPLSVVTYALMFLVELSVGRARDAFSHLRLATESLKDMKRFGWSDEAFNITLFGVHALNVNWAALTYQKPPDPTLPNLDVFDQVELDRPGQSWHNYKIESDAGGCDVPTHAIEVAKEYATLSVIHLDTIIAWCGSSGKIRSSDIIALYKRYLSWRKELSAALASQAADTRSDDTLPFVLVLHINYAVGVCQLFNPLLENSSLSSQAKAEISKLLTRFAREGILLYEKFSKLFSNRYQTPLQAFCLVHLADIILRQDRSNADPIIHFTLQQLGEALPGFPVVGALQAMFCETVLACGLHLPKDVEILMGGRSWQSYSREDKLGCSERLTYAQPVDRLAETIDDSFAVTFEKEWEEFVKGDERPRIDSAGNKSGSEESVSSAFGQRPSDVRAMDINSIMNP